MATKARHLKTPIQLWIADNRKAGPNGDGEPEYTSAELAAWTGVTEDTARGWESRGRPSEDALLTLERKFGKPAPRAQPNAPTSTDTGALVKAIADLVAEMKLAREEQARWNKGVEDALAQLRDDPKGEGQTSDPASRPRGAVPQ